MSLLWRRRREKRPLSELPPGGGAGGPSVPASRGLGLEDSLSALTAGPAHASPAARGPLGISVKDLVKARTDITAVVAE